MSRRKLFRSTSLVALMTLLSRLLGFARDIVLAQVFGASPTFDAFVVAFKIPNFMRRLFGEGAFSQAFIPILAEYRSQRTFKETYHFINRIAGTLGFFTLLVVIVAQIIAPLIVMLFAPGFLHDPMRYTLTTHLLRIIFPYLLLITLTAFAGATLNTFGRFGVPAFAPVLLNIALIAVTWWWAPHVQTPIYVLAWGVLIGGVAQLLVQLPALKKIGLFPVPTISFKDSGVKRVLKLMLPALFGVSVAQLSLLIDNFFASFLPPGSISWLYYSDRLTYLPLGIFGVALTTVIMPYLARQHSQNKAEEFSHTIDWALRCNLTVGLPAAVGLFVLAGPLLATLIHRGAFNDFDVIMTSKSLAAFALGLPSFMLVKALASAFYAKQNIKLPVKVAAVSMIVNLLLNLALIGPLKHAGLALATSLASWINTGLLFYQLVRQSTYRPSRQSIVLLIRILIANIVMATLLWWLSGDLQQWLNWSLWQRIWHLFIIMISGMLSYFITLLLIGVRKFDYYPKT